MSLINDLLTDLENRRGGHREQQTVFADLAAVSDNLDNDSRGAARVRLIWLIVLLLTIAAGYLRMQHTPDSGYLTAQASEDEAATQGGIIPPEARLHAVEYELTQSETAAIEATENEVRESATLPVMNHMPLQLATSLSATPAQPIELAAARQNHEQPVTLEPEAAASDALTRNLQPALQRIQLDEKDNTVMLKFSLAGKPEHRTYLLSDPHRMVVEFEHAAYEVNADPVANHRHIKSIRNGRHDDALKVVFDLNQPMKLVDSRYVSDGDASQLLVSLQSLTEAPVAGAGKSEVAAAADKADSKADPPVVIHNRQMHKRPRAPGSDSREPDDYQRGLELYSRAEFQQSIAALNSAVEKDPQHGQAHYLLVSALLQINQRTAAEQHLEHALRDIPDHWDMRRLYAHLLTDRGDFQSALAILRQASPRLADDPDYHALIAALHQQLEDHVPAMQVYRQLVEVRPANSIWWMGLGISLEALARPEEALVSYRRALDGGALAADLRQFVSGRIQSLVGEQSS